MEGSLYAIDGNTVVTSSTFSTEPVRLWDVPGCRTVVKRRLARPHQLCLRCCLSTPDGEQSRSPVSWDGTARALEREHWTQNHLQAAHDLSDLPADQRNCSRASRCTRRRAASSQPPVATIKSGSWTWQRTRNLHPPRLPGSSILESPSATGAICWHGARKKACKSGMRNGGRSSLPICTTIAVVAVAFNPDDTWLATGVEDRTVEFGTWPSSRTFGLLDGHAAPVYALAVSKDGNWLASGSRDGTVRIWNTHTWTGGRRAEARSRRLWRGLQPRWLQRASPQPVATAWFGCGTRRPSSSSPSWKATRITSIRWRSSPDGTRLVSCSGRLDSRASGIRCRRQSGSQAGRHLQRRGQFYVWTGISSEALRRYPSIDRVGIGQFQPATSAKALAPKLKFVNAFRESHVSRRRFWPPSSQPKILRSIAL